MEYPYQRIINGRRSLLMGKKLGKVILGLACTGAAVAAVLTYRKEHPANNKFKDDFDDFTDEFENCSCERTYTTIPYANVSEE